MLPVGTVIVITHNSADCLHQCLTSLAKDGRWRVLVIDNASSDSSAAVADRFSPAIEIICNKENMGFAAAVNQGVKTVQDEVLVVMNPDVVATPGALNVLSESLIADHVGAAGGALKNASGTVESGFTVRRFPDLVSALAEVLLINRVWPSNPANRKYRCLDLDYTRKQTVEQPAGACLAFRRSAWESVGGWDEGFFPVWFEDVDFCQKLANADWARLYCPDAVFIHAGGHSVNKLSFCDRQTFWYRNLLRYFCKYHPSWQVLLLRTGIVAGLALRCLLSLLPVRPAGVSIWEAVSGYVRVARQCALARNNFRPDSSLGILSRG
jgi:N-acetylglucosaminyl-diphospho-decaprenol L-rhamnosyltransferase